MKYLFIVRGQGREHFLQALALEDMLICNGHQVVKILVGTKNKQGVPAFFTNESQALVETFWSPYKLTSLFRVFSLFYSIWFVHHQIKKARVDKVVNFYDMTVGLVYLLSSCATPYICIGYQYLFLHNGYVFPFKGACKIGILRFATRLTSIRSKERIALSFRRLWNDRRNRILVVPPLIRKDVILCQGKPKNDLLIYLTDNQYINEINSYHMAHPDRSVLVIINNIQEKWRQVVDDDKLTFYTYKNDELIRQLSDSCACVAPAEFDLICEVNQMGKPLMIFAKGTVQKCVAFDAIRAGLAMYSNKLGLDRFQRFVYSYNPNEDFTEWISVNEMYMLPILEQSRMSIRMFDEQREHSMC